MMKQQKISYSFCLIGLFIFSFRDLSGMFERFGFGIFVSSSAINEQDHNGDSSLHRAADTFYLLELVGAMTVNSLLNKGANPNISNHQGRTPLHCSVHWCNELMVKFLLSKGAVVNAQDNEGNVPLHQAVANHTLDIAKHLIDAGADENIENRQGRRPISFACNQDALILIRNTVTARALRQNNEAIINAHRVDIVFSGKPELLDLRYDVLKFLN